jgi:hypothetical protein
MMDLSLQQTLSLLMLGGLGVSIGMLIISLVTANQGLDIGDPSPHATTQDAAAAAGARVLRIQPKLRVKPSRAAYHSTA